MQYVLHIKKYLFIIEIHENMKNRKYFQRFSSELIENFI
jgi:hypothetical protein